jgi:glycosyltransferase involved in cell wall biosynthesis
MDSKDNNVEVSVIMPCLNEEQTVGICINKCFEVFEAEKINGEVIVVDNGSNDKSREIILRTKARLVEETRKGYGSAYLKGFSGAKGKYLVMADSDDTYDFLEMSKFIELIKLDNCDFVIGTRLKGKIGDGKGTMPWLHRYIGNPFLTAMLRSLFRVRISDVYCGMRVMTKEAYEKICPKSTGMEFALEMVINATKARLSIQEISINYGLRIGESKLRTVKDGWRSLRFILLYSPTALFMFPGFILMLSGILFLLLLLPGPLTVGRITLDYHYMFIASLFCITGYQVLNLGFFTKIYSYSERFENEKDDKIVGFFFRHFTLERMIVIGCASFAVGSSLLGYIVYIWIKSDFGNLFAVRNMIASVNLIILGTQTIFNGFFYSILRIEKK